MIEPRAMTGLDTNILVRFLTKSDPDQANRAKALLQTLKPESPGFIPLVSLIELAWVLRSKYRLSKVDLIEHLERLLNTAELAVENHTAVSQALQRFAGGTADFADCLIERSCHLAGCRETVTFDKDASRSTGMRLL
jgi:predicted nucleic-acid-binding protein